MALDLDFVRAQFPGLAGDWVAFDNAGGSQILAGVVERISAYLLESNVQHGASYAKSEQAGARLGEAERRIATLINARRPEEVVLGPSTTMLLHLLAEAVAPRFAPGDEIVVTNCDHEANIGPWLRLRARGVEVRSWAVDPETLELELEALDRLMTPRTRLVCLTHASNVLGTINRVAEIAAFVHARGAKLCVDAVAYAPHRIVDVQAWDVDYYVFSFYKIYGPHHAVLYGHYDDLRALDSLNHFFIGRDAVPYKFQPGNVNYELAYGCIGIVDYLEELGTRAGAGGGSRARLQSAFEAIATHEEELAARLLDYLRGKNRVRIIGHSQADRAIRVPTVSFVVNERDSAAIVRHVDRYGIGIRYGDFYARRLIEDLDLGAQNGVVRVSMVHYNTLSEVDRLIHHLDEVL